MTVYFTENNDLILFHFHMKNLNMFNILRIEMMKISLMKLSDTVVLSWRQREICILVCVCFYVNIRLNKNKSLVQQNLLNIRKSFLSIGRNKNLKSKLKKKMNQVTAKAKNVKFTEAFFLLKLQHLRWSTLLK